MKTATQRRPSTRQHAEPIRILRWLFLRGIKVITCELRVNGQHSLDVCVVPHWDVSASVVERYDRAAGALRRHAEIARVFREAGWALLRETADPHADAAA